MSEASINDFELERLRKTVDANAAKEIDSKKAMHEVRHITLRILTWAVVASIVVAVFVLGGWMHQSDNNVKIEQVKADAQVRMAGK